MDDLTSVVTILAAFWILAAFCAIVAGKAILSSSSSQASGSSEIKGQARKVNDSLYELHRPVLTPSVQIVLFHGLQPGDYSDAHLRAWQSEDGSCIWPQTWLVHADAVPGAHVLSVSYNGGLANSSRGESDMYIITESILSDLLLGRIGQEDYCPVILVGHCIGGLVIKQLCHRAHGMLNNKAGLQEKDRLEKFLNNIKGIFYYATPHHGTSIPKKWEKYLPLLTYFKALSKDTARLNSEFDKLDRVCNDWSFAALGEDRATNWGPLKFFFKSVFVPEATARIADFNVVNGADHFSICKPSNQLSRSFYTLKKFVLDIAKDAQDEREYICLQKEALAKENSRRNDLKWVPKYITGLDSSVNEITGKLDNIRTLGLVGMGGLGKSTLATVVFNRLAPNFVYTCFIPTVKLIAGNKSKVIERIEKEMYCSGKKVNGSEHEWRMKPLLLVLDDIYEERDGKVISEIEDTTSAESRIHFTTRNQRPLDYLGEVYQVDFLNNASAKQLFLSCAFSDPKSPPPELEGLISAIIQKCEGLPLALEVLGKFLRRIKKYEIWEQTLHAMGRADEGDIDQRLWENLRLSYKGLEKKLQQMYLDATTIFSSENWTLYEAKAVWRIAYDTLSESLLWQKLVDMSLVYDVKDNECIRVHEQLQSLGRKIARESIKRRVWDGDEGLKLLQNTEDLHEQGIVALRVGKDSERILCSMEDKGIHISNFANPNLKDLRYLEVIVPVHGDGAQDLPFQAKLVKLQCLAPMLSLVLLQPALGANVVSLHVSWKGSCLPTCIGSFSKLRFLTLEGAADLESLPDEIGNLSQLEVLKLISCYKLQILPKSFGNLSLNHLHLDSDELQTLPESFGNLSALKHLDLDCDELQTLPKSFMNLSALSNLKLKSELQTLPESFGNLSALSHLQLRCSNLQTLPESFGMLSALRDLWIGGCQQLQTLPESFGNLPDLQDLTFAGCNELQTLPESFGNLSALSHLTFDRCAKLHTLPKSFTKLRALSHLECISCDNLKALPEFLQGALPVEAEIIFRQGFPKGQGRWIRELTGCISSHGEEDDNSFVMDSEDGVQ